jgi:hypothetical protein
MLMARYLSLIMLVFLAALPYAGQGRAVLRAGDSARAYFTETGQWVGDVFLKKWRDGGGLPLYGFPLTAAYWEGGYSVQLFERVRMEWHPEWAGSPYEVSLGQLGKERLLSEGLRVPAPGPTPPGSRLFPETGYSAGGLFLRAWEQYGGLSHFGYPLSPEMRDEESGLLVQYFERARMEHHPEHAGTPHEILFTLLGSERAAALDPLLRARWSASQGGAEISVEPQGRQVQTLLGAVTVRTTHAGDLYVLGGDNRRYATYKVEANKPLTMRAAGAAGPQSFVLLSGGEVIGARWNAFSTSVPRWGIESGDPVWDGLYGRVEGYLRGSAVEYNYPHSPRIVRGHRSPDNSALWLRDHVYTMRGSRYFERDTQSALEYFATTQRPDGSLDDFLFHTPATPVFTGQIEIEADREFLFVEGVYAAWQSTGDDEWLRRMLPSMRRALEHTFTDPRRWSAEHGLVKRAFTIDMWDYEQGSDGDNIRRDIDKDTRWSIMHGDNTGTYRSALLLAGMERRLGNEVEARRWEDRARDLLRNLNRVSWNGRFFRHQVHLTPILPTGVDEERQISLSNAYALNRGALTGEQARAIIETYRERGQHGGRIFAEWYSIDPPFEANFGLPGQYVNGGVMPLVGGELARGALSHGHEEYGLDILRRYWALTERWGGSYLWYHPDGRPGIGTAETIATDGWGSSAMLAALTEGLAGVVDEDARFRRVSLSPRWAASGRTSASVALRYPASDAYFAYRWEQSGSITRLTWGGHETAEVKLHLLLPPNATPRELLVNGTPTPFTISRVEGSLYLDATLPGIGHAEIK